MSKDVVQFVICSFEVIDRGMYAFSHPVAWFKARTLLFSLSVGLIAIHVYRSARDPLVGCGIVRFPSSTCTALDGIGSPKIHCKRISTF